MKLKLTKEKEGKKTAFTLSRLAIYDAYYDAIKK